MVLVIRAPPSLAGPIKACGFAVTNGADLIACRCIQVLLTGTCFFSLEGSSQGAVVQPTPRTPSFADLATVGV